MTSVTVSTYTSGSVSRIEKTSYTLDDTGIRTSSLREVDANADGTFESRVKTTLLNDKQNHTA